MVPAVMRSFDDEDDLCLLLSDVSIDSSVIRRKASIRIIVETKSEERLKE